MARVDELSSTRICDIARILAVGLRAMQRWEYSGPMFPESQGCLLDDFPPTVLSVHGVNGAREPGKENP
jgi:hypothetical protein